MRLIDLDKLHEFPIRENHYDRENGNIHFIFGIETVMEYAESLPTVDAEPVRHAYMLTDEDGNIECSNCGSGECWGNYCMNCGAKMDGGEENVDK